MKIYEYIIRIKDQASDKVKRFANSLSSTDRNTKRFANNVDKASGSMQSLGGITQSLARWVGPAALGAALVAGATKASALAREFEQTRVSFEVMMGSVQKGRALLGDIVDMANVTPFTSRDLQSSAKLLLGYGVNAKKVIPTLKMLGDISGGNAERLHLLSLAYAQTQAAGRLMGQDLNQMINSGFNPLKVISEKTGLSIGQLKEKMEKGAISAKMVEEAFRLATAEGGQFFNMMDKQSQTFEGRMSTLQDKFELWLTGVGTKFNDWLSPLLDKAIEILDLAMPEDVVSKNNKQRDYFHNLYTKTLPLIDQYEKMVELQSNGVDKQKELLKLTDQIRKVIPLATMSTKGKDGIDVEKARQFVTQQESLFQGGNDAAQEKLKAQITDLLKTKAELNKDYNRLLEDQGISTKALSDIQNKYQVGVKGFIDRSISVDGKKTDSILREKVSSKFLDALRDKDHNTVLTTMLEEIGRLNGEAATLDEKLQGLRSDKVLAYVPDQEEKKQNVFAGLTNGEGDDKDGTKKISGGGKQAVNVTINLNNLIGQQNFDVKNIKETMRDMEKEVIEALLRVLNSANYAASQ